MEIPTHLTLDDLFKLIEKLPAQVLNKLIKYAIDIQTKRGWLLYDNEEEQSLLAVINDVLPAKRQNYPNLLREKQQNESLTYQEQIELLQFVQVVEKQDLQRTEALIKLAKKRNIPLNTLMQDLGIGIFHALKS